MMATSEPPDSCDVLASYLLAKLAVVQAGFEREIAWQELRSLEDVDERLFLREAAWVVLSSGMRESVIRALFPAVEAAFGQWQSARWIVENDRECKRLAEQTFRHSRKIAALVDISRTVASCGVEPILNDLRANGPDALCVLPYMGPATSRHLAKNLGIDTAKPDRHLVRVAEATGFASPASLCEQLAQAVGDTVAVVDLVIWRFATISSDYLEFFQQRRCSRREANAFTKDAGALHGPRCMAGWDLDTN
jgi:hypothetical protein